MRSPITGFAPLTAIMALTLSGLAYAQPAEDETGGDGWRGTGLQGVGVGLITSTQPYAEIEDSTLVNVIPSLSYDRDRIWIAGKQFGYILTDPESEEGFELSALLDYRFQGYDADDSPVLAGMADRNGTLEAGAVATYAFGDARILGQARFDVLGEHEGYDLTAQLEYNFKPFEYTFVRATAGALYRSADLADYYYGVRDDEAIANIRPDYEAGETISPILGLSIRQPLSRKIGVGLFVSHEFLPDEIQDSPIIDASSQTTIGITLSTLFLGE